MSAKPFRIIVLGCILLFLVVPALGEDTVPKPPIPVEVTNFPDTQNVSGTVDVGNLPEDEEGNIKVNVQKGAALPCDLYKFIGVTTAKTNGGAGWKAMNEMCISEYGENARMCSTEEVMKTPVAQWTVLTSDAWVHPSIIAAGNVYLDYSGKSAGDAYNLSCSSWGFAQESMRGLALQTSGHINFRQCSEISAITCCTPYE